MPTISQWPVVVSLPGEARAQRPKAPAGSAAGGMPVGGLMLPRPRRARWGRRSARRRAMLPRVSPAGGSGGGGGGDRGDGWERGVWREGRAGGADARGARRGRAVRGGLRAGREYRAGRAAERGSGAGRDAAEGRSDHKRDGGRMERG